MWVYSRRRTRGDALRGNVPAAGVRREPRRDAPRQQRQRHPGRRADADDPAGVATRAAPSRSRVSLSRVRLTTRARPSHPPLGTRRADDSVESSGPVPTTSSGGARGRLRDYARGERRAELPDAARPIAARGSAARTGAIVARRGTAPPPRRTRATHRCAHRDAELGGRATGPRVRDVGDASACVSSLDQALFVSERHILQPSHSQTPRPITHSRS